MISPLRALENWVAKRIARDVLVDAYIANSETGLIIVDVSLGLRMVERLKIHPKRGAHGGDCGDPLCNGIHRQLV